MCDTDFALKEKGRAPKSLDKALSVALRGEAWERSVGHSRQNEDRPDRPRQKARVAGKTDTAKESQGLKPNPQVAELELKRLSETPRAPKGVTDTRGVSAQSSPFQKQRMEATASAGEGPRPLMTQVRDYQMPMQNRTFLPSQRPACWWCGLQGHIKRN